MVKILPRFSKKGFEMYYFLKHLKRVKPFSKRPNGNPGESLTGEASVNQNKMLKWFWFCYIRWNLVKFGEIRWNSVKFGLNEFDRIYFSEFGFAFGKPNYSVKFGFGQKRIPKKWIRPRLLCCLCCYNRSSCYTTPSYCTGTCLLLFEIGVHLLKECLKKEVPTETNKSSFSSRFPFWNSVNDISCVCASAVALNVW